MAELKQKRKGNYHHNGNKKHGLFNENKDLIDNNKGYSPDNCRFITPAENSRNRRNTKFLTVQGVTKCVAEWCREKNVSQFTVYWWIREKGIKYAEQRLSEIA